MSRFEMDDSEHTAKEPAKWWELMEETAAQVRYSYDEIMEHGSDELRNAAQIILGGYKPGGMPIKEESA